MASSRLKSSQQIYDPVRKRWVKATPEERIRQALVNKMTGELGYPAKLVSIEKELSQLPHLALLPKKGIPQRRVDILVFTKQIPSDFSLAPLLMIECKAVALTPKFAQQVIGYNAFVRAPFVALANEAEVLTGWFDRNLGHYHFAPSLPSFASLLENLKN